MPTLRSANAFRSTVAPLLAALIWGSAFVAQDIMANDLSPFTVNCVRSWIGAFALLLLSLIVKKKTDMPTKQRTLYRKRLLIGGVGCGILLTAAMNLQQAGIGETDPGKAGFITSLYVVLVPILGVFFRRRVPHTVWIGIGLAVIGLYFLCITDTFTIAPSDALILLCALFFALQILLVDHLADIDGVHLSCVQFFTVAGISTILMFVFEAPSLPLIFKHWVPLLYVSIFSSAVAYTLQIIAQKGNNPTVVSLLLCLESVFAALTGWLLLGDTLSSREWAGCLLMFVSVILATLTPATHSRAK